MSLLTNGCFKANLRTGCSTPQVQLLLASSACSCSCDAVDTAHITTHAAQIRPSKTTLLTGMWHAAWHVVALRHYGIILQDVGTTTMHLGQCACTAGSRCCPVEMPSYAAAVLASDCIQCALPVCLRILQGTLGADKLILPGLKKFELQPSSGS